VGHFRTALATGIAAWSHSQIFFVRLVSLRAVLQLFNSALHHLSTHRTAPFTLSYSPINEIQ